MRLEAFKVTYLAETFDEVVVIWPIESNDPCVRSQLGERAGVEVVAYADDGSEDRPDRLRFAALGYMISQCMRC